MRAQPIRAEEGAYVGRRFALVRWGPSFAGAISAIAIAALFSALWWAIGYGSGVGFVRSNFAWFFLATVVGALLIGGLIMGRASDLRGVRSGLYGGLTVWALTAVAALIPLTLRGVALANAGTGQPATATAFSISSGDTWALFGTIVGALAASLTGAVMGAVVPRAVPAETAPAHEPGEAGTWRRTG